MKKRAVCLLLAVILLAGLLSTGALAAGLTNFRTVKSYSVNHFSDVAASDWFYPNVKRAYELALIDGRSETSFAPAENITVAEAIKLAACLHSIYYSGAANFPEASPWYRPYVDYALQYGIISSEYPNYNKLAARWEFASIFAASLPADALARKNSVSDGAIPDVPAASGYASAVYSLYRAGILDGNDEYGSFSPNANILRREVAAIVTRMADETLRVSLSLDRTELTAAQVYARCSPAVFYIELYNASGAAIATGSGFFISADGVAVTNYHVIDGASSAKIQTTDGRVYNVKGVYDWDAARDLALLQIDGGGFSFLDTDSSGAYSGGETVYAIGSPLGLDNTISQGLISNPHRVLDGQDYIQISVPISHGSSGGALINTWGRVIGVTSAGFDEGQNLNLAIPVSAADALSRGSLTPLPVSAPSGSTVISCSTASVSLNVGGSYTANVTLSNSDYAGVTWSAAGQNVTVCAWGEYNASYTAIPVTFYAVGRGSTTVTLSAYDENENIISSVDVAVKVSGANSTVYYPGFYPVPDYGVFTGAPLYDYEWKSGEHTYVYLLSQIPVSSETAVTGYANLLTANGFTLTDKYDNTSGYTTLEFTNGVYSIQLLFGVGTSDGGECIVLNMTRS